MPTVIDNLTLLTPLSIRKRHRDGACLCGQRPGPDSVLTQVVSLALPPGIEAIVVQAATWRVVRVGVLRGFDLLAVEPFEHLLVPKPGEWLWLCPAELYF